MQQCIIYVEEEPRHHHRGIRLHLGTQAVDLLIGAVLHSIVTIIKTKYHQRYESMNCGGVREDKEKRTKQRRR